MAGIGGVACDFVKGAHNEPKQRIDLWQRPGIDGYGAQRMGKGDSPFRFRGIKRDTSANIDTWAQQLEALQGQIISVVDDWETTHSNLLVQRVSLPAKMPYLDGAVTKARGEVMVEGVRV